MYGKGGTRETVGRAVGMYDEVLPITAGMRAKEFLRAFRGCMRSGRCSGMGDALGSFVGSFDALFQI